MIITPLLEQYSKWKASQPFMLKNDCAHYNRVFVISSTILIPNITRRIISVIARLLTGKKSFRFAAMSDHLYIRFMVTPFALSNPIACWLLFHRNRLVIDFTSSEFPVNGFVPLISDPRFVS